jgi:hypothetical protein
MCLSYVLTIIIVDKDYKYPTDFSDDEEDDEEDEM